MTNLSNTLFFFLFQNYWDKQFQTNLQTWLTDFSKGKLDLYLTLWMLHVKLRFWFIFGVELLTFVTAMLVQYSHFLI